MGDPMRGLDADTILTPYAQQIADAGFTDVGRYLKNLTAEEVAALHAVGLGIWLIFERGAEDVLDGDAQGAADGTIALAQAQALGVPAGVAIYATADTDLSDAQATVAESYWWAFDAQINPAGYKIGGYADGVTLAELLMHGLNYPWLAGARGWAGYSDFVVTNNAVMIQGPQLGAGETAIWEDIEWPALPFPYDPNMMLADDIGAWMPPS